MTRVRTLQFKPKIEVFTHADSPVRGCTKYRPVTITNATGAAILGFPIPVQLAYDADMRSDFRDIRFVSEFTAGIRLLPHWLEYYDASYASFRVLLDVLPAGGITIYCCYGNAFSGADISRDPREIFCGQMDDFQTKPADWNALTARFRMAGWYNEYTAGSNSYIFATNDDTLIDSGCAPLGHTQGVYMLKSASAGVDAGMYPFTARMLPTARRIVEYRMGAYYPTGGVGYSRLYFSYGGNERFQVHHSRGQVGCRDNTGDCALDGLSATSKHWCRIVVYIDATAGQFQVDHYAADFYTLLSSTGILNMYSSACTYTDMMFYMRLTDSHPGNNCTKFANFISYLWYNPQPAATVGAEVVMTDLIPYGVRKKLLVPEQSLISLSFEQSVEGGDQQFSFELAMPPQEYLNIGDRVLITTENGHGPTFVGEILEVPFSNVNQYEPSDTMLNDIESYANDAALQVDFSVIRDYVGGITTMGLTIAARAYMRTSPGSRGVQSGEAIAGGGASQCPGYMFGFRCDFGPGYFLGAQDITGYEYSINVGVLAVVGDLHEYYSHVGIYLFDASGNYIWKDFTKEFNEIIIGLNADKPQYWIRMFISEKDYTARGGSAVVDLTAITAMEIRTVASNSFNVVWPFPYLIFDDFIKYPYEITLPDTVEYVDRKLMYAGCGFDSYLSFFTVDVAEADIEPSALATQVIANAPGIQGGTLTATSKIMSVSAVKTLGKTLMEQITKMCGDYFYLVTQNENVTDYPCPWVYLFPWATIATSVNYLREEIDFRLPENARVSGRELINYGVLKTGYVAYKGTVNATNVLATVCQRQSLLYYGQRYKGLTAPDLTAESGGQGQHYGVSYCREHGFPQLELANVDLTEPRIMTVGNRVRLYYGKSGNYIEGLVKVLRYDFSGNAWKVQFSLGLITKQARIVTGAISKLNGLADRLAVMTEQNIKQTT